MDDAALSWFQICRWESDAPIPSDLRPDPQNGRTPHYSMRELEGIGFIGWLALSNGKKKIKETNIKVNTAPTSLARLVNILPGRNGMSTLSTKYPVIALHVTFKASTEITQPIVEVKIMNKGSLSMTPICKIHKEANTAKHPSVQYKGVKVIIKTSRAFMKLSHQGLIFRVNMARAEYTFQQRNPAQLFPLCSPKPSPHHHISPARPPCLQ